VERLDAHPAVAQRPCQAVGADLRADEDDGLLRALGLQHAGEGLRLLAVRRLDVELVDRVDSQRGRAHLDRLRVVHPLLGQAPDLRRHRGREQSRLAAGRAAPQDGLDVLEEAEVEHLVGLVEHHVARVGQHEVMAIHHVHHAADGSDHHVRALAQERRLVADRRAAEDRHDVDALALAVRAQRLGDLDAQLARRREHQRLHLRAPRIDVLEQRQAERGGLAGAGLRLADHVAPGEQRGDRLLLDRRGLVVAEVRECLEHRLGQPEFGEGCHAVRLGGRVE
jgi:hypothetical protein